MNINAIYVDFWEKLGQYLSSDDLFSFMVTCKQAYKACKRHSLRIRMSYPMSYPWRLTYEQRNLVKELENGTQRFKLIHGDVGSGKTIVSTSYAIRKYLANQDPNNQVSNNVDNGKIVMCGPPSLIKMWWSTLTKYFNINPCVLHNTNPNYSNQSWHKKPDEQFILISYRLFGLHHRHLDDWFDANKDLLIIDEAHHHASIPFYNFKEVIGLSATTTKKSGLSSGIRHILSHFNLKIEDCTYTLDKTVITKSLPPVEHYPYLLQVSENIILELKRKIRYVKDVKDYDMTTVSEMCKLISHPILLDLQTEYTGGCIMIGRKTFHVDEGNSTVRKNIAKQIDLENPGITYRERNKLILSRITFDIAKAGRDYPKYVQAYNIIKWANDRGDKVLLFDTSVTYLPFLHKFLISYGINSYIFSTHYDVSGRQNQLTKFKEDEKPGVLLSSIAMLGEGQNVTEANHVIFFTQGVDGTKYYQAVGRCWRYPQVKTVYVHLLFGNKFDQAVYSHACNAADLKTLDWESLF